MNDAALATTIDTLCGTAAMPPWDAILGRLLQHFDCVVGTVHLLDAGDGLLKLRAHQGLPPPVVDKVAVIPAASNASLMITASSSMLVASVISAMMD